MVLNHEQISQLLDQGVVENGQYSAINGASLDIHLGGTVLRETIGCDRYVEYRKRQPLVMREIDISAGFQLNPGEFVLAHTLERFNLPADICAEYKLKSSMARIGLEHLNAGWCFAAGTQVEMLDGTTRSIEDIHEGDYVYSLKQNGDVCAGKVLRSGVSGRVTKTLVVTLDNGASFECTPEHKVMRRNGTYVEAQHLVAGDALMPLKRKVDKTGHELVYCPHTEIKSNWRNLHGRYKRTHRLVFGADSTDAIHHINENPRDNRPENLRSMSQAEHTALHNTQRNKSSEARARSSAHMKSLMKKKWADPRYVEQQRARNRANAGAWNEKLWGNQEHREAMRAVQSANGTKALSRIDRAAMQAKSKLGALRKAVEKLVAAGRTVTAAEYTAIKRQNAPTVETLALNFGSFEAAVALVGYENHAVTSVTHKEYTEAVPVYDITVEGTHNFALTSGVFVHNCDPTWHGSVLTLELKNLTQYHTIILKPGDAIGQMIFRRMQPVSASHSYANVGRYNQDASVSGIKQ